MFHKLFTVTIANIFQSQLFQKTSGTFGLRIAFTGLSFIIGIILARLLGVEEYGIFNYAMTWVSLLQIPAGLGLRDISVRQIAIYQSKNQWGLIIGLIQWANKLVVFVSLTLIGISILSSLFFTSNFSESQLFVLRLSLLALPFASLAELAQGELIGLQKMIVALISPMLINPCIFLVLLVISYFSFHNDFNVLVAMSLRVLTIALDCFCSLFLLRKYLPKQIPKIVANYQVRIWMKSMLPFMFISSAYYLNSRTDTLMLGALKGAEEVGLYSVASKGAEFIGFILLAANISFGPQIANLYSKNDISKLQALTIKSSYGIFLGSLPIALGMIFLGKWFLWIFGREFISGYPSLIALSVGQIINAATGVVGLLLGMTGNERSTAIGIGVSALINIILNAILIPKWGTLGASIATSISTAILSILLVSFVYQKLKIYSTIFGGLFTNKNS